MRQVSFAFIVPCPPALFEQKNHSLLRCITSASLISRRVAYESRCDTKAPYHTTDRSDIPWSHQPAKFESSTLSIMTMAAQPDSAGAHGGLKVISSEHWGQGHREVSAASCHRPFSWGFSSLYHMAVFYLQLIWINFSRKISWGSIKCFPELQIYCIYHVPIIC